MFKGRYKTQPSSAAKMAIIYITLGALMVVWSVIWALYLMTHTPVKDTIWFWCLGFVLTGVTLIGIGMAVGRIGRTARQADTTEDAEVHQDTASPPPANNDNAQQAAALPQATVPPAPTREQPPAPPARQV